MAQSSQMQRRREGPTKRLNNFAAFRVADGTMFVHRIPFVIVFVAIAHDPATPTLVLHPGGELSVYDKRTMDVS